MLRPGFVSREDSLDLIQRSYPGLTVAHAVRSFFHYPLEHAGLQQLQQCEALSGRWRDTAARRLASGQLEDWSSRLHGLPLEGMRA
ncbi:6-N-hydroxylaminopurine resistance protein [compost metagenome]